MIMASEQLVGHLKQAIAKGQSRDQIRASLVNGVWSPADIDAAFASIDGAAATVAPKETDVDADVLPSAVNMWKRSWAIFRKRTATFVGIAAFSVIPMIIVYVMLETNKWPWTLLAVNVMSLGQMLVMLAYIFAMHGGEDVGVNEAYRRAVKKLPGAVWLSIISFIVVFGATGFFIIPGIILSGWFMFSFYLFALENQGGMNALFCSREYVKGKWWTAFGYMLFPAFIGVVLSLVFGAVFSALHVPYAKDVVSVGLSVVFTPVSSIYLYLVYAGFKAKKGKIEVVTSKGRKAKYIIFGLIGHVLMGIFVGGIIMLAIGASRSAATSKITAPSPSLNANAPATGN